MTKKQRPTAGPSTTTTATEAPSSFLDHTRNRRTFDCYSTRSFAGFDPDYHKAALFDVTVIKKLTLLMPEDVDANETKEDFVKRGEYGDLIARSGEPIRTEIVEIKGMNSTIIRVSDKLRGADAVAAMIKTMTEYWIAFDTSTFCKVLIESQQFYPRSEDNQAKRVSKANALIGLATISGAMAYIAMQRGVDVELAKPFAWKRNRRKAAHHQQAIDAIYNIKDRKTEIRRLVFGYDSKREQYVKEADYLTSLSSHEKDAMCMAFTKAGIL